MLESVTYYTVAGLPLIVYAGIVTLFLSLLTASISILNKRGKNWIGFKWHPRVAYVTIAFAIAHALLGLLSYV
jgi:hypothetical protein